MNRFYVIGLDDNMRQYFPPEILEIISSHRVFSGGVRHHEIVRSLLPEKADWIDIKVPLDEVFDRYRSYDGRESIVVFASGDPLFFGFAVTIQNRLPDAQIRLYPSFNSLQLLAQNLLMPYHDMRIVSLTGRPWHEFDRALIESASKIGVLTDREHTPTTIARRMLEYGYDNYTMFVGERLGNTERQSIRQFSIQAAAMNNFVHPNCLILKKERDGHSRKFGLPDSAFEHLNGREKMITKMPIRLLSLSMLDLRNRERFWDIGFCTGSVSIEAKLLFPHLHITSFEIREEGRKLMTENCHRFGTPGIEAIIGDFLSVDLSALEAPDAIFIGGHGGKLVEILMVVSKKMKENGAEVHILTALDDIAWMLNIRGNDIPCNPVVLSYLVLTETESHLFIQEETLNEKVKQYLADLGISLHPYDAVYDFVSGITGKTILLEKAKVNYTICQSVMGSNTIVNVMNPASSLKAVKTPVEMENIRKAHIKDGVAVTRFVYWLKKNIGKIPMDEVSVAEKLESFRKEQEGFIEPSFGTISAYGPNAAMCHYQATKDNFSVLQPKGMYLVDSGGQYYEGTTDITRTIVVGPLTEEEKEHFTITAMGTLRLGNAKFLHGCIGINLDYLARQAFWERGLDFNHGTGHGVGYLLNVHERPNGFRWKMVPERMENAVLEEGMLTSDEPGIYIEGSHGIRTENLMLCRKAEKNMYGQFMCFEFVTMVPIDLDGVDTQYMTEKDVELLNNYHKEVYEKISPYLEGDEKEWLKEATRPISK